MEELNQLKASESGCTPMPERTEPMEDNQQQKKGKPLTQTRLLFSKPVHSQTGNNNSAVLETNAVDMATQMPDNFKYLMPYYEMISVSTEKNYRKYVMKCLLCVEEKQKEQSVITDKAVTSFARHLQRIHPNDFLQYEKAKNLPKSSPLSAQPLITSCTYVAPYARNDPRQKRFELDLTNFLILDMRPFSLVEGEGFQKMIHNLDKKIIFPHRTTIQRWFDEDFKKVQEKIKQKLAATSNGSLHFILDIWTSQQGKSIIGVKVQFITDWRINQLVVGFKHFPGAHSAENIRNFVDKFLGKEMGVRPEQVGSVTADNAANILAAFRNTSEVAMPTEATPGSSSQTVTIQPVSEDNEDLHYLEESAVVDENQDLEFFTGLEEWTNTPILRNSCLAHLLHLAVKDTLKKSPYATLLVKRITETVTFFHNSPKWTDVLTNNSGGLVLMKPVETRWSSVYTALERILQTKDKKRMSDAINTTLVQAKGELPKRTKMPKTFEDDDLESISLLAELLEPCSYFTNKLQSDQVTSSVVILGVINMIKHITNVSVDSNVAHSVELDAFRNSLCENIMKRFSTDPAELGKSGCRGRKIVTLNVFQNEMYIISSILDCRIKTTCFEDSFEKGDYFNDKLPSKEVALRMLQDKMEGIRANDPIDRKANASDLSLNNKEGPPEKKSKSMFSLVINANKEHKKTEPTCSTSELQDYLNKEVDIGRNMENYSPLTFWEKNECLFPRLSSLAKNYLGMPASSGAVERLFSVAAGMGKARNARLLPETTEKLLCCQSHRLNLRF